MASGPTPSVTITLGGAERHLRYTTRALVSIEDATGKASSETSMRLMMGSVRTIATMIWGGLLHEDPKLTIDDVIDMIDLRDQEVLMTAIGRALAISQGKDPDKIGEEGEEGAESAEGKAPQA